MRIFSTFLLCAAGVVLGGPIYVVTDLGSLGGSAAQGFGINSSGLVVGSASTAFGYTHAFSSFGGGLTDLTLNSGANEGSASGVNSSGAIVGTQYVNGQAYAAEWTNGYAQLIGAAGSFANAINDSGMVAGMLPNGRAFAGGSEFTAFRWSSAYGINSSGTAAGYAQVSPGVFRGFVWTPSTGYVLIDTLGGTNSYAMSINDAGQVAGNAQVRSGYSHAFLWSNGILRDLGTLGGSSYAYGLNANGDVVGYSQTSNGAHAFAFENGAMFDLNALIDPRSGWVLEQAYGINGSGQITGAGLLNGVEHAFRLDYAPGYTDVPLQSAAATPEPGTWMLAIAGLALILSSKIRFRPRPQQRQQDRKHEPPQ
jgi:probable HAF family extracellular repeat protein